MGINQWKHDSDSGDFIIDVMFLFIGPIKPDWLADCSSSDKAPIAHISVLCAYCSVNPVIGFAFSFLSATALLRVTCADVQILMCLRFEKLVYQKYSTNP